MTFASRLTRCPIPYDPERGAESRDRLPSLPPELRELLAGAAGCSPYLCGLIDREADWLGAALAGTPEAALDEALDGLAEQAPDLWATRCGRPSGGWRCWRGWPIWAGSGRWNR